jgi:hypothetical protein
MTKAARFGPTDMHMQGATPFLMAASALNVAPAHMGGPPSAGDRPSGTSATALRAIM